MDAGAAEFARRRSPGRRCSPTSRPATRSSARPATAGSSSRRSRAAASPATSTPSCGVGESTTDVVFGGHCLIAENGVAPRRVAAVPPRRAPARRRRRPRPAAHDRAADQQLRRRSRSRPRRRPRVPPRRLRRCEPTPPTPALLRDVDAHPFVPAGPGDAATSAATRSSTRRSPGWPSGSSTSASRRCRIGVSGGLDSTLALLVACKTFDALGVPRDRIQALTMPGFGTTGRTQGERPRPDASSSASSAREMRHPRRCASTQMQALGPRPVRHRARRAETVEALTEKLRHLPPDDAQRPRLRERAGARADRACS